MLEFLEDIIGSNRLKEPLAKLQQRVDETNEERAEKMNRVKAIQKEKDALEGPRNEAIKFIQLENDVVQEKNKLFQLLRKKDMDKRDCAYEVFREHNEKLKEAMKEIESLQEMKNSLMQEARGKESAFSQHKNDVETAQKRFREMENEDLKLGELVKGTKNKGKKLQADLAKEEDNLEKLTGKPAELDEEIEELADKKAILEKDKEKADQELEKVRGKIQQETSELSERKEEKQQKLLQLQSGVDEAKSAMDIAISEFDLYISKQRSERAKLEQFKFKLDANARTIGEKKTALNKFTGSLPDMEKELDAHKRNLKDKTEKLEMLNQEVRNLKSKENESRNKMNSTRNRNKVQSALLDAKKKGVLKGIIGRLGDLGTIHPDFDVSVSTACGRLDNMVVETREDAKAAINFLKTHNLPVTTFIALDQMDQYMSKMNSMGDPPEGTKRLFDLIVPNHERFKVAFYFGVFDTIVCKNLDHAKETFNRKRIRIVTLSGEMFETSGAMTGGGPKQKGKMTLSSRRSSVGTGMDDELSEESLNQIRENISTKEGQIIMLSEELGGIQVKIEKLEDDIGIMKERAPGLEMAIKALESQQEPIERNIKEAEKAVKDSAPDPKRVEELDKKKELTTKEYKNRAAEAEVIQTEIQAIKDQVKEILEKSLGAAKKKAQKVKSDLDSVSREMAKKAAEKKTAERNIERSQQKIQSLKAETEEAINKIKELREEKKKLEEQAEELQNKCRDIESLTHGFQEEINAIVKKIDVIKKKESQFNSDNLDLKHEVDKHEAAFKEREQEVKRWTEKLKTLELQAVPDDEFNPDEEEEYEDVVEVSDSEETEEEDMEMTEDQTKSEQEQLVVNEYNAIDDRSSSQSTIIADSLKTEVGESETMEVVNDEAQPVVKESEAPKTKKVVKKTYKKVKITKKRKKHSIPSFSKYELSLMDGNRVKSKLEALETELKSMKPNMASIAEFKKKMEVFMERSKELTLVTEKRDMYKSQYESLRNQRMQEFKDGFYTITNKLKEMYRCITAGGDADLEWADSLDPFSEGVNFTVRPNKKSWKKISNLSGGEKTLSSLSLIFALHFYKPSPLYVMDEIDAALDFKNVSIVAQYIKDRTKNTQFIIISLRNNMYELAYRLVGIYKTHNCTKSVVLVPTDFPSDLTRVAISTQSQQIKKNPLSEQNEKVIKTSTQIPDSSAEIRDMSSQS
jgi:structural maintenance of chromosome 4